MRGGGVRVVICGSFGWIYIVDLSVQFAMYVGFGAIKNKKRSVILD